VGFAEGRAEEAGTLLRVVGDGKFGPADARTAAAIDRIDDLERLEELCNRLASAGSWQELLGQPRATRRGGRRRPSP
jgi:hypothetical protein